MKYYIFIFLFALSINASAQKKEVIAYYPGYHKEYKINYAKNLDLNGSADKITVLYYAFAVPMPDPAGDIIPILMHPYSAYKEIYSSENSVDGIADSSNQQLRGQFNQLKELKEKHPNIKIMLSIGGWGGSIYFSDLALTAESREIFVNKCIDMFINGNLPVENGAGGKGSARGIFDGFDIDWEFPVSGGTEETHYNINDMENQTALFTLFRSKLDSIENKDYKSAGINKKYFLTAAVSARVWEFWKYNFQEDQKYLDWFNVMTYDFHGAGDSITGHNTNLLSSPEDPDPLKESLDHSVKYLLDTVRISGNKIVPGAAFYGKSWSNIDSVHFGLYQPAKKSGQNSQVGFINYHDFSHKIKNSNITHWDDLAMAPWLYIPGEKTFLSYDDVRSVALKARYVDSYNLRGLMFWEISGDDSSGTLVNSIYNMDPPDFTAYSPGENNLLPSVKIIEPGKDKKIIANSSVIIKTKVNDTDGRVVKVEFFVDGKSIGYNTLSPFDWVWFNALPGIHKIIAVAIDNNEGKTISDTVEIQVTSQK